MLSMLRCWLPKDQYAVIWLVFSLFGLALFYGSARLNIDLAGASVLFCQ